MHFSENTHTSGPLNQVPLDGWGGGRSPNHTTLMGLLVLFAEYYQHITITPITFITFLRVVMGLLNMQNKSEQRVRLCRISTLDKTIRIQNLEDQENSLVIPTYISNSLKTGKGSFFIPRLCISMQLKIPMQNARIKFQLVIDIQVEYFNYVNYL